MGKCATQNDQILNVHFDDMHRKVLWIFYKPKKTVYLNIIPDGFCEFRSMYCKNKPAHQNGETQLQKTKVPRPFVRMHINHDYNITRAGALMRFPLTRNKFLLTTFG